MGAPAESTIMACMRYFETLTDASVDDIRALAAPEIRYRDPFRDAQGIEAVVAYLHKWFQDLDDIRIVRGENALAGNVLLSHWVMHFRIKKMPKQPRTIEGMSRTVFDDNGKVIDHTDYWDSAPVLETFPLLGRAVGCIRKLPAGPGRRAGCPAVSYSARPWRPTGAAELAG